MPSKKLFPNSKPKRENGAGIAVGYALTWKGAQWHPLVAPAPSLAKALSGGTPLSIAAEFDPVPGIFELAIAPRENMTNRVEVYVDATESLNDALRAVLDLRGLLKGFLDDALKHHHCIWIRCKQFSSFENARKEKEKILEKFDYAWVQQQYAPARTLIMRPRKFLGCCCRIGFDTVEGPPKFSKQGGSFKKERSGKR